MSVITRDRHADVGGDDASAERLDTGAGLADHFDRVGAGALRERQGDGRLERPLFVRVEDVVGGIVGGRADLRHGAEADGLAAFQADHELAEILLLGQGAADLQVDLFAAEGAAPQVARLIGLLDRGDDLGRG